jgi:hypothetical protein
MSVTAANISSVRASSGEVAQPAGLWLRSPGWDMLFITLSVFLVPLPYLLYLLGKEFGMTSDVSRNLVNGVVSVLVGGPHMYATFLRTAFDQKFSKRYPMLIRSSIIIPIVVISLAFLNLTLLLAVFFFWALVHVLHQVTYITELYNHRKDQANGFEEKETFLPQSLSMPSRFIDYAVVMTCMFPFTAYKISQGTFNVGSNHLTSVIPGIFQAEWFFIAMTSVFFLSVMAYIGKSWMEYRRGHLHWPKTIFIVITVIVASIIPALPNLDTAFQGLNTWHSFQYLALTFLIIRLREKRGELEDAAPFVHKLAKGNNSRKLYFFTITLLLGSAFVFAFMFGIVAIMEPNNIGSNRHFDIAYYTAILCFLWIHYYHDHFLFTDFEAIDA